LQVIIEGISQSGREAVDPGADDNQVFFDMLHNASLNEKAVTIPNINLIYAAKKLILF
jgi:hypothetical protein